MSAPAGSGILVGPGVGPPAPKLVVALSVGPFAVVAGLQYLHLLLPALQHPFQQLFFTHGFIYSHCLSIPGVLLAGLGQCQHSPPHVKGGVESAAVFPNGESQQLGIGELRPSLLHQVPTQGPKKQSFKMCCLGPGHSYACSFLSLGPFLSRLQFLCECHWSVLGSPLKFAWLILQRVSLYLWQLIILSLCD